MLEKCISKQISSPTVLDQLRSEVWILSTRMYKPWTAVNVLMVSLLHLLQGSEHGSVKVGGLELIDFALRQFKRVLGLPGFPVDNNCAFSVASFELFLGKV